MGIYCMIFVQQKNCIFLRRIKSCLDLFVRGQRLRKSSLLSVLNLTPSLYRQYFICFTIIIWECVSAVQEPLCQVLYKQHKSFWTGVFK